MKRIMKSVTLSVLLTTQTFAASLIDEAKNSGLIAIPSENKALTKLISNPANYMNQAKLTLGMMLYFDPRLSKSGLISCNTCHNLGLGGSDGMIATVGDKWTIHPKHLNSPTVYNAVFYTRQSWDGRNPDLEDQAHGPIQAKPVMASSKEYVTSFINSIPEYVDRFHKAYSSTGEVPFEQVGHAIAAFERTLVTPSRYDDFLNGNKKALTKVEQKGLKTFIEKGCVSCHNGIALGGSMQPFGIFSPYKYIEAGSFRGDKNGMVRVPTLRNITETAPYFHNGKIEVLPKAIKEMGRIQLGIELSDDETNQIETFLKSLEGRKPAIVYPILPASTKKTPKVSP
jgi:cytochrome c peroxidase